MHSENLVAHISQHAEWLGINVLWRSCNIHSKHWAGRCSWSTFHKDAHFMLIFTIQETQSVNISLMLLTGSIVPLMGYVFLSHSSSPSSPALTPVCKAMPKYIVTKTPILYNVIMALSTFLAINYRLITTSFVFISGTLGLQVVWYSLNGIGGNW